MGLSCGYPFFQPTAPKFDLLMSTQPAPTPLPGQELAPLSSVPSRTTPPFKNPALIPPTDHGSAPPPQGPNSNTSACSPSSTPGLQAAGTVPKSEHLMKRSFDIDAPPFSTCDPLAALLEGQGQRGCSSSQELEQRRDARVEESQGQRPQPDPQEQQCRLTSQEQCRLTQNQEQCRSTPALDHAWTLESNTADQWVPQVWNLFSELLCLQMLQNNNLQWSLLGPSEGFRL